MQNLCAACSESCNSKLCSEGNWARLNFLKLHKATSLFQDKLKVFHSTRTWFSLLWPMLWHFCDVPHAPVSPVVSIPAPPDVHTAGCFSQWMNCISLCFRVHREIQTSLSEVSPWSLLLFFIRINTIVYHSSNTNPSFFHFYSYGWILHVSLSWKYWFSCYCFAWVRVLYCVYWVK